MALAGQFRDVESLPPVPTPHDWRRDGLCAQVDSEMFFPDRGGSSREAKKVCKACPVQAECLRWALDTEEHFGIWGGLSEKERRRLKGGRGGKQSAA